MSSFFSKSILKPEGSIMAGVAVAGTVFAVYNLNAGSVASAHASDANHPAMASARKKAGYTSFVLVSALFLITRDGNVGTLGYASIVAMELSYRHAIMSEPASGMMVPPAHGVDDFTPAGAGPGGSNVVPITDSGPAYNTGY